MIKALPTRLPGIARWSAWWLLPLILLGALLLARTLPNVDEYVISHAQRSNCTDSDADWQAFDLPLFTHGQDCLRVLLEPRVDLAQSHEQALLVSGVGRDARIWVNGNLLREFDRRPAFDSTSLPLLIMLQPGIIRGGENEILLQLRSGGSRFDRSYLGHVLVGPGEALRPAWERSRALGGNGAQLAIVLGVAILVTLLPIALKRRREVGYRWYAAAVACSLIYIFNMGWPLRPLPSALWYVFAHLGLAAALWSMLRYSIALAGSAAGFRRWIDRLSLLAALVLLPAVLVDHETLSTVAHVGFRAVLLLQLLLLASYWWRQDAQRFPLARWLAAAALLILLLGLADSARVLGLYSHAMAPYLLHWGILYLLVLLLIGQVKDILEALQSAELAQARLSLALDQRSSELQQEFTRRQTAEQARTLAEERQRIMRDMHDGVGGQLVALIGQVERGQLDAPTMKQQLRRSLDDLRLMIDSLDDACADLGVAFGMLRQRLQASLSGLPLTVRWDTAQLPDLAPRAPGEVLHVLRLLQEAITNALKHAQCSEIVVRARWHSGMLSVEVEDNGIGMRSGAPSGRGLASMRQRAASLGAEIEIREQAGGVCVRIELPQALAATDAD